MSRLPGIFKTGFWRSITLRTRLVVLFTLILSVGFTLAATALLGILQAHLVGQVDRELEESARRTAVSTAEALLNSREPNIPSNYYFHFKTVDGSENSLITPESADRFGVPVTGELLPMGVYPQGAMTRPVKVPSTKDGSSWRAVAVPISVNNQPYGVVTIALPLTDTDETLVNTAQYFLLLGILITVVGATTSYYMVRLALRPLKRIETVAKQISVENVSQRIDPEPETSEIGSLTTSLNRMLARIEQSFMERDATQAKVRRFVSDASHELRTPLAAIRGYAELYRMGGVPESGTKDVMNRIESEATRMGTLVEDLLTLARLDEKRELNVERVDLMELIRNASFDLRALDSSRVVQVLSLNDGEDAPEHFYAMADRDQMTQVFTNIIGNIVRYTPNGTPVEFAVGKTEGTLIVEVRDHGPGISASDQEKVFARFYRTDVSRSRESGGSGLGLAIVASIMALHSGKASLMRTEGGGLTVKLRLPGLKIANEEDASEPTTTQ